jgi:hypothetical protein
VSRPTVSARKTREPGPEGFTWRGVELRPVEGGAVRTWASTPIDLGGRAADWRVEQPAEGGAWHARLRIGADRFANWGSTAAGALAAAAGEAANVATFIVAMLPEGELPGLNEATELRRSRRPRRAKKARR